MEATTATTAPTLKLTKGNWGDRYNVHLDGTYIGWVIRPTEHTPGWTPYPTAAGSVLAASVGEVCATRAEAIEHLCQIQNRISGDFELRMLCQRFMWTA